MNSDFSVKHVLSYRLCSRHKNFCSYVSVYYGNYFGIMFNATLMFSNKLINDNVELPVAFYFILSHDNLKKQMLGYSKSTYHIMRLSVILLILPYFNLSTLFKNNFYLHICIFECNFASFDCDHIFSPNRDKAE